MNAIVDVQGFKTDDNKFIIKEIAILCEDRIQVFLIKPPFASYELSKTEKTQVSWIERNRNIYWSEGFIPYHDYKYYTNIVNILKDKYVFTKGSEKQVWLQDILNNKCIVYNLEDKGCPNILSLYDKYKNSAKVMKCVYHSNVCALKNVLCLYLWCYENKVF